MRLFFHRGIVISNIIILSHALYCSFRLILRPSANFSHESIRNPDTAPNWADVFAVQPLAMSSICPICLSEVVVAVSTKCSHIYWYVFCTLLRDCISMRNIYLASHAFSNIWTHSPAGRARCARVRPSRAMTCAL